MTVIIDGRVVASSSAVPYDDPRAYLLALYPDAVIALLADVDTEATPLIAHVNHGVWIAACSCPAEGLPSPGMIVWLDMPLGWCVRCGNAAAGGRWRPVVLPTDGEREMIEAVLALRPSIETRNWEPGESVDDLVAENVEHGVPAPEGV